MSELQVTQCPYCKTHFRLSQEQLSAAAGNVRCGACLKVFNALSSNPEVPTRPAIGRHNAAGELLIHDDLELDDLDLEALGLDESIVDEVNPPLSASREEAPLPTEVIEPDLSAAADDFFNDDPPLSLAETAQLHDPDELHSFSAIEEADNLDLHEDFIATPPARDIKPQQRLEPVIPVAVEPPAVINLPATARLLPLQDDVRASGIFLRDRPATGFSAEIDHDPLESGLSAHSYPTPADDLQTDEIDDRHAGRNEPRLDDNLTLPELEDEPLLLDEVTRPSRRPKHNWIWKLLCVIAALALIVQAVIYNLDAWARDAKWRPTLESICLVAGCELPVRVDISQVRSSNLLVRPHPEFPNAVAIDVIIYNRADYPQPFPVVRMTFSDSQGDSVSEKRFRPEEYLGGELAGRNLMPPQTPIHIALSMVAPGPRASSYALDFLSP